MWTPQSLGFWLQIQQMDVDRQYALSRHYLAVNKAKYATACEFDTVTFLFPGLLWPRKPHHFDYSEPYPYDLEPNRSFLYGVLEGQDIESPTWATKREASGSVAPCTAQAERKYCCGGFESRYSSMTLSKLELRKPESESDNSSSNGVHLSTTYLGLVWATGGYVNFPLTQSCHGIAISCLAGWRSRYRPGHHGTTEELAFLNSEEAFPRVAEWLAGNTINFYWARRRVFPDAWFCGVLSRDACFEVQWVMFVSNGRKSARDLCASRKQVKASGGTLTLLLGLSFGCRAAFELSSIQHLWRLSSCSLTLSATWNVIRAMVEHEEPDDMFLSRDHRHGLRSLWVMGSLRYQVVGERRCMPSSWWDTYNDLCVLMIGLMRTGGIMWRLRIEKFEATRVLRRKYQSVEQNTSRNLHYASQGSRLALALPGPSSTLESFRDTKK
ncbi:uncharacterized protein BDR25DRAFT_354841 [Lindgomyces ingoldianus]|uniref:Uncharacterized protein n=1 Tax=Lindgomyces ingoldianus TaxID=673940 RepID=A0ACB6QVC6_9PLEO|nr:uncharacterized protein BDR25DRAFT_354841 [Lindgomyces ingoldianus]KAF2470896.1 hypothetical protein BDR25DRAFT_354841 [Lindgomyces ingoldianus]